VMSQRYIFREFLQRFIDKPDDLELMNLLKSLPIPTPDGPWIAGGAIRRTLSHQPLDSDIDYFFKDQKQKADFEATLLERHGWLISTREHAATYGMKVEHKTIIVQAISMAYYPSLDAVLDSFDFTITQFGYDGADLVCGQFALWDLARKRLALHRLTYGVSTVRRLIKYTRQGFTACGGVLASILEATVANPGVINSTVHYVD
jgi:hypothetical protein